jgi:hypothetical protein
MVNDKSVLSYQERINLKNLLIVCFVQGKDEADEDIFVYLGIDGNGIERLKEKLAEGKPVKIKDFGTIIASGKGFPDARTRARMRAEYRFGEKETNVRILPEVDELL